MAKWLARLPCNPGVFRSEPAQVLCALPQIEMNVLFVKVHLKPLITTHFYSEKKLFTSERKRQNGRINVFCAYILFERAALAFFFH